MSFWDDLTGQTAADAAEAAAEDTYAKQQQAIADLYAYGDQYRNEFAELGQAFNPYIETGQAANSQLMQLMQDPSFLAQLPGYQFDLQQGTNALDRSAASRGMLNSGRSAKDLMRFGTGLADKTYGDQLARLLGVTGMGLKATGGQVGTIGTGLQGQLDTRKQGAGYDYGSASTTGQGMIASANAQSQGTQNLLNTGLSIGGSLFGLW